MKRGWTNETFARMVRAVRRHPAIPTHATVSDWRTGRRPPSHDMRVYIEIVTKGAVAFDGWPRAEKFAMGQERSALEVVR